MSNEQAVADPNENIAACPLCAHSRIEALDRLTGKELRLLWKELGRQFSVGAWGRIHEHFVVTRHRCQDCGFVFFHPTLAGDEGFYRELEHSAYYTPDRPEFARTIGFARAKGLRTVLDVGCGSGAFLDLARKAGCDTSGLELNRAAAQSASAKGHRIYNRLLDELDDGLPEGGFDLITLFQVLEHVPGPVSVLKQAAALLNPDGYISVAVPSEEGINRLNPWDPHQWPPHHLSRWRLADLEQLACAAQLRLVRKGGDMLLGTTIEQVWKNHNRMASVVGKPLRPGGGQLPEIISFAYRKTGMKFFFPNLGNSIYGYFQILRA